MPLDLCDIYGGGCHGCLMARDPYCGWDQGQCVSIYSSRRYVGWDPLSLGEGRHRSGGGVNGQQEASVLGAGPFWPDLLTLVDTGWGMRIEKGWVCGLLSA